MGDYRQREPNDFPPTFPDDMIAPTAFSRGIGDSFGSGPAWQLSARSARHVAFGEPLRFARRTTRDPFEHALGRGIAGRNEERPVDLVAGMGEWTYAGRPGRVGRVVRGARVVHASRPCRDVGSLVRCGATPYARRGSDRRGRTPEARSLSPSHTPSCPSTLTSYFLSLLGFAGRSSRSMPGFPANIEPGRLLRRLRSNSRYSVDIGEYLTSLNVSLPLTRLDMRDLRLFRKNSRNSRRDPRESHQ